MIELIYNIKGRFHVVCDCCGAESVEAFDNYQDAVDAKEEEGFESKKYIGEDCFNGWMDLCEECQKG